MIFKKKFTNNKTQETVNKHDIDWVDYLFTFDESSHDSHCPIDENNDTYKDKELQDAVESAYEAIFKVLELYEEKTGEEHLKECPICGSTCHTHMSPEEGKWYIECGYCPLETAAIFETEVEAIDYWNDRI